MSCKPFPFRIASAAGGGGRNAEREKGARVARRSSLSVVAPPGRARRRRAFHDGTRPGEGPSRQRWPQGQVLTAQAQPRAADREIRLFFELPSVRSALCRLELGNPIGETVRVAEKREKKRGRTSFVHPRLLYLFAASPFALVGRPRGRSDCSTPSRLAIRCRQAGFPNGIPRRTGLRGTSSSASVSHPLTCDTQAPGHGMGQSDKSARASTSPRSRRQRLDQRQSSARSTSSACNAFRST